MIYAHVYQLMWKHGADFRQVIIFFCKAIDNTTL